MTREAPHRLLSLARTLAALSLILLLPLLTVGLLPASAGAGGSESSGSDILAAQPEVIRHRVLRGEIAQIEPDPGLFFQALLTFERPVDRVSNLLGQTERQTEFRKDLKQAATLAVFQDGALQRQRMRYGFFDFVVHLRYVVDVAGRRIQWALDDRFENDLRRLNGYWELHPLTESRTLARFGSQVELRLPTPATLQREATRRDIERVQRWVNSEGLWRP
ncbi:MAG: hypothetical protein QNK05_21970 [Myxococcota bacterium]|nr:hypothetical protein [Myxococcota bacterium]